MDDPFEIGSRLVDEVVELRPQTATMLGIPGHDHRWDDHSPSGSEAVAEVYRRHREALAGHVDHPDRRGRLAARVLYDWLDQRLDQFEHLDHLRDLSHIASSFDQLRDIFEVMDKDTAEGWEAIATRLETIHRPYQGYRETLDEGLRRRVVVAGRQVRSVIDQAREVAGAESAYLRLPSQAAANGFDDLVDRLGEAVDHARAQAAAFADYLESTYLPQAEPSDGVGRDRYLRAAASFLGMIIEPEEVYAWGWEEVARLLGEMERVGSQILPGAEIPEVLHLLETDPDRAAGSPEELVAFVTERQERALAELEGSHFDVPPQVRRVTVNLAPPGSPPGAYYLPPSEDFSRPGSIWYSLGERTVFPLYQEVSTAYHEGFPGHHLQVGSVMTQAERLSRAHRLLVWYSGYGEGWALYAERLMDELGYFETPEYVFGMLGLQMLRAVRVVVDLGLHLGFDIPEGAPLHSGQPWTFERAVDYVARMALQEAGLAESEVKRYLGFAAQAISYKVGEREILSLREEARRRAGDGFSLVDFHRRMLRDGEMGLDLLREVIWDE